MMDMMVEWAMKESTALFVLAGAAVFIILEAARVSRNGNWGDLLEEDE